MKKILFILLIGSLTLSSCSTINKMQQAQQERAEFMKMKGEWVITDITYDKSLRIKSFDEGIDVECFKGSQWNLIPNNYSGTYTLNACKSITQPIKFELIDGSIFQFKKIAPAVKSKNSIYGYQLKLEQASENTFSLKQTVPFDGEMVDIIYHFRRLQQ